MHRVSIDEFNAWFEGRLVKKYTPCLLGVLEALKPVLAGFHEMRSHAAAMGQAMQKMERPPSGLRQYVDFAIHQIDKVTADFPVCPLDSEFLAAFLKQCHTALDELERSVPKLASASQGDYSLARHAAAIRDTMLDQMPAELAELEDEINESSSLGLTQHVYRLKHRFAERAQELLEAWASLQTAEQQALAERLQAQRTRHSAVQARHAEVRLNPQFLREQELGQRCEQLQRSVGGMLQPFVRASQMLKGGGKGKKGGQLLGGLELSSEEASLLHRNTQLLMRHLSPGSAETVTAPNDLLRELQTGSAGLEDFLHCLHLLTEAAHQMAHPKVKEGEKSPKESESHKEVAAACASFEHTALRSSLDSWREALARHTSLKADSQYLAIAEAFKSAEREVASTKKELLKVVDEYRAALGLYHRTMANFQQLRFEVAQCCGHELSLVVELTLPAGGKQK